MIDIKSIYKNELALFYGDKEKLAENLKERIDRYRNAPQTPKVKERIELLEGILNEAER